MSPRRFGIGHAPLRVSASCVACPDDRGIIAGFLAPSLGAAQYRRPGNTPRPHRQFRTRPQRSRRNRRHEPRWGHLQPPLLWVNGAMTDLGTLGGSFGWAADVNDFGQIAGTSSNATGSSRAFVW